MKRLIKYLPYIAIIGTSFILFFANYVPGTFLIGWDNLMPEFNLWLNIKRNIFAVWQEYRGLGLLDGQAHSANTIHTLSIAFLRIFLPIEVTRYVLTLLLHCVGGIGMYLFMNSIVKKRAPALIAAIFYMLNIGIVQQFYAPLETFVFQFAFLPFCMYWGYRYIQDHTRSSLMWFGFITLLMTPQAFVPTVFVVSVWGLLFLSSLDIAMNHSIKRFLVLLAITLAINSFWLLPYVYDLPGKSDVIRNARINEFSSEETFIRNKARGDIVNVLSMKGFMLDIKEYDDSLSAQVNFMQSWSEYSSTILYSLSFLALFVVIIIGFFTSWSNPLYIPLYGIFFICFVLLGTDIPIISSLINIMRERVPIFGEAVRFPFTKFITLFAFAYAAFLAAGTTFIWEKMRSMQGKKIASIAICVLVLVTAIPAFTGNFFSSTVRKEVPHEYQDLFAYLNTYNSEARIAVLPLHTFWSWQSKNWGYLGSGFEWFGIQQPILVRAFDPWSSENEQYFNELSYALYSQDITLFNSVVQKYNIGLILLDKSINNELSTKAINFDKLEEFLISTNKVTPLQEFGELALFQVANPISSTYFSPSPIRVGSTFSKTKIDTSYSDGFINIYDKSKPDIIFPFPSLVTENLQGNREFDAKLLEKNIVLTTTSKTELSELTSFDLTIPSLFMNEELIPAKFTLEGNTLLVKIMYPEIFINNEKIEIPSEEYRFVTNVKGSQKIIVNSDTEIAPGEITFIRNHFLNVFKVKNAQLEQLIEFDTNVLEPQPYVIPLNISSLTQFKAVLPVATGLSAYPDILNNNDFTALEQSGANLIKTCTKKSQGTVTKEFGQLVFTTICRDNEIAYSLDTLLHNSSYLLFIHNKYVEGLPPTIYINNEFEKRTELQSRLSKESTSNVFALYPSQKAFEGYGLHILSQSLNKDPSVSQIESISIYPAPLKTLGLIRLSKPELDLSNQPAKASPINNEKTSSFLYKVVINEPGTLVLSQAFHKGWYAYRLDGLFPERISRHVLANNWANGWEIEKSSDGKSQRILIIFWPQLLQFVGFFVAFAGLGWIIFANRPLDHSRLQKPSSM